MIKNEENNVFYTCQQENLTLISLGAVDTKLAKTESNKNIGRLGRWRNKKKNSQGQVDLKK